MIVNFDEIFGKSTFNINKIYNEAVKNRECWVCAHDKDLSDDRNTYHECIYGIERPCGQQCLLWEEKHES